MNKKKLFDPHNAIPDGEGFNALPIAFIYTLLRHCESSALPLEAVSLGYRRLLRPWAPRNDGR